MGEGVMAVKEEILKIWKEMERKCTTVSVEVKKTQHRYIIGPKGNSINEILAETGVFVEMPSNDSESETITLRGPQDKLGLALTKVYEKANSVTSLIVDCPSWLHKYIIGKKGAGIQKISAELSKVHIAFCDDDKIKIDGPPDEAEKAFTEVEGQAKNLIKTTSFVEFKSTQSITSTSSVKEAAPSTRLNQRATLPSIFRTPTVVLQLFGLRETRPEWRRPRRSFKVWSRRWRMRRKRALLLKTGSIDRSS